MHHEPHIRADQGSRSIVPGRSVKVSAESTRVHVPRQGGKPHLELIREGDLIKAIEFTCGCGQRHTIQCVY